MKRIDKLYSVLYKARFLLLINIFLTLTIIFLIMNLDQGQPSWPLYILGFILNVLFFDLVYYEYMLGPWKKELGQVGIFQNVILWRDSLTEYVDENEVKRVIVRSIDKIREKYPDGNYGPVKKFEIFLVKSNGFQVGKNSKAVGLTYPEAHVSKIAFGMGSDLGMKALGFEVMLNVCQELFPNQKEEDDIIFLKENDII